MVSLPVHPRLARMLLGAGDEPARALACDLAALLSERDPLRGSEAGADLAPRLAALEAWRERRVRRGIDGGACARVDRVARQLRATAGTERGELATAPPDAGALLSLAYPDRIALRRSESGDAVRYRLSGGRAARLPRTDPLASSPLLVVASLDARAADAGVWLAAALAAADLETLHRDRIRRTRRVAWDERAGAVAAVAERRLDDLVLDALPLSSPDPDAVHAAMLDGVRRLGLAALPWTQAARSLQARVLCLREWLPEQGWPDLADAALGTNPEDWLAPWLGGMSRREHLARLDMVAVLRALLGRGRAVRRPASAGLGAGRAAGTCREAAGDVRCHRHPAGGGRPGAGDAAPALPRRAAGAGYRGPGGILGTWLRRGAQGAARPLPPAPVAGGPADRAADGARQAAALTGRSTPAQPACAAMKPLTAATSGSITSQCCGRCSRSS